jgi:hypothetical protein
MRGPIGFGKPHKTSAATLRHIRKFHTTTVESKATEPPPQKDEPVLVNPDGEVAPEEHAEEEEEEDATLPGDKMRMMYSMQGKGWTPVNARQPAPDTSDMGTSMSMLINRDVIQKIADSLKLKIPFSLAQEALKRHVDTGTPSIRTMQEAAKDLMPIFDRETRTTVPPAYRRKLTQMLARAMYTYYLGKDGSLTGRGIRRKPSKYYPHAQAFVRGVTIALKPALNIGAAALRFHPNPIYRNLLSPAVTVASSSL